MTRDRYSLLMADGLFEEAEAQAAEDLQQLKDWAAWDERELERKAHAGPRGDALYEVDGEHGPSMRVRRNEWESA